MPGLSGVMSSGLALVVGNDLVGSAVPADEEAEAERAAADLLLAAHQFGAGERVGEPLGLLQAQQPQREPGPGRDPMLLPRQPVEERGGQQQPEVGLGLAATGGEPDRVDDVGLASGSARNGSADSRKPTWNGRHVGVLVPRRSEPIALFISWNARRISGRLAAAAVQPGGGPARQDISVAARSASARIAQSTVPRCRASRAAGDQFASSYAASASTSAVSCGSGSLARVRNDRSGFVRSLFQ